MLSIDDHSVVDFVLVEDNPNDVELTLRALRKNHILNKIQVINDGEEALNFLFRKGNYRNRSQDCEPKLIILDLKLPKMNGHEILKLVKTDEKLKLIPIVVLTSSKEEKDIIESYKLGVNSYIVKPVDFEKFIEAVKQLGLYWLLLNNPPK